MTDRRKTVGDLNIAGTVGGTELGETDQGPNHLYYSVVNSKATCSIVSMVMVAVVYSENKNKKKWRSFLNIVNLSPVPSMSGRTGNESRKSNAVLVWLPAEKKDGSFGAYLKTVDSKSSCYLQVEEGFSKMEATNEIKK